MKYELPVERPNDEIPILDLGPYLAGQEGAAREVAETLTWIQEEIGFYYIVNHGIAPAVIVAAYDQVEKFHDLPLAQKLKLQVNERSVGYVPIRSTVYVTSDVNDNTRKDLNENFRLVRERPDDHPSIRAGRRFNGPNQWPSPELLPDFRSAMLAYYNAMENLAFRMLSLYALALGLDENYFDKMFTDPLWLTRNVHYPPEEAEENQFGISPHTDHGFITLLPISKVPGLEVKCQEGGWIPARYVEDALIVNSGDFMKMWTNERFIATPHRVLAPAEDRYISAFFYNPNWDARCDPLPGCAGPENPPKYQAVTMLDHVCNYVDRNYTQSAGGQQADKAFA